MESILSPIALQQGLLGVVSSMAGQPLQSANDTRIKYHKDFLIYCFRNPACKKKPKDLAKILEVTLDAPRIQGMDPCPPFVAPVPYRHPHFAGRTNERYRNTQYGSYSRPRNHGQGHSSNSALRHSQEELFPENGQYQIPLPLVMPMPMQMPLPPPPPPPKQEPETDLSEFDIRRLYNRREGYNGNRPTNLSDGNPPAMYNLTSTFPENKTVLPEPAASSDKEYARQLGDSLRMMLSIGNGSTDKDATPIEAAATMPLQETTPVAPVDENQQSFQKIMDELVTKGTRKVFERKQALGMLFGVSS